MAGAAASLDPNSAGNLNIDEALRDAMTGSGAPESWKRLPEEVLEQSTDYAETKQAMAEAQMGGMEGQQ